MLDVLCPLLPTRKSVRTNSDPTPSALRYIPPSLNNSCGSDVSKQTVNSIAAIIGTFSAAAFVKYATWNWSYRLNVCILITIACPDAYRVTGNCVCHLRSGSLTRLQTSTTCHPTCRRTSRDPTRGRLLWHHLTRWVFSKLCVES